MNSKVTFNRGIGTSSILMIFVVLCLTTFGILSFVTVKSDFALTTKNALSVQEYYKVDAEADKVLQVIDAKILEVTQNVNLINDTDEQSSQYMISLSTSLSDVNNLTVSEAYDEFDTAYLQGTITIPINKIEQLQLTININDVNSNERYTVISHKKITTDEWEQQDEGLNVWQG